MSNTALIDGDICAYRCAASSNNEPDASVSILRVDDLINRIIQETAATDFLIYLSGPRNYRYDIDPEYKANRKDMPRPQWLEDTRAHLVVKWGAIVCDGIEADDALGIAQTEHKGMSIICSIDKDLKQVPGYHYDFVKQREVHIDEIDGYFNFYSQLILGDRSDNVFGFDGKARTTIPKFLQEHFDQLALFDNEYAMFEYVRDMYQDDERLLKNGRLLWIKRSEQEELWNFPSTPKQDTEQE